MKRLQPVIWTKGTFLSPQHLQLQDRFLENLLQFHLDSLSFRPWGFRSLQISREALTAGSLGISSASSAASRLVRPRQMGLYSPIAAIPRRWQIRSGVKPPSASMPRTLANSASLPSRGRSRLESCGSGLVGTIPRG